MRDNIATFGRSRVDLRRALRFTAALAALLLMPGCDCADPWAAFPERTPPDQSCSTGSVHGFDVYIWHCLRGQRVVVAQYSAEMQCRPPERAVAPCGTLTTIEVKLKLSALQCAGPRSGRAWP